MILNKLYSSTSQAIYIMHTVRNVNYELTKCAHFPHGFKRAICDQLKDGTRLTVHTNTGVQCRQYLTII